MGAAPLAGASAAVIDTAKSPGQTMDKFPIVLDLAQVDAADLAVAGGKAANLGELIQAGFPVPPGFVVTTYAYDQVVANRGFAGLIPSAIKSANGAAVRQAIEQAAVPLAITEAILAAYRGMGSGPVAVRSSATAEDLPDAAFAGQQDSFLGIVDESELLRAVRRCWASLWSDRAIAYRGRHGFAHADVKLAVVVQRLIAAEAAGVMFTANPITGARDETIIDASTGLGEAIVSGLVTPDHMVLRRGRLGWRIVERQLGRHEVEIRALPDGGTELIAGDGDAGPVLADADLRRLARMGAAIQRHFGRPQDVEWARASGKLYALQSRPITALPAEQPRPARFALPRGGPTEYFQARPYPLDMTSWLPAIGAALMRMFPAGNNFPSFETMWIEENGVVTRLGDPPEFHLTPGLLLIPLRMIPLAWRYDPAHWRDDPFLEHSLARIRHLEALALPSLRWAGLVAAAREAMAVPYDVVELRRRYFPRTLFALGALRLLLEALGHGKQFGEILSGVDNKTLQANRALEVLASEVRADPTLTARFQQYDAPDLREILAADASGSQFLKRFDDFLASYGYRETVSPLLVSAPTWHDAPEAVLGILKGLSVAAPPRRDGQPEWESARDEVLQHPVFQFPPARQAFSILLAAARRFSDLREDTHFLMIMAMPTLRRIFMEMGRRLAGVGALAAAEDVFHLRFDELERLTEAWPPSDETVGVLRAAVHDRARRREALADTPVVRLPAATSDALPGDALVAGTAGSPGVARGPVRIVAGVAAFGTLQPGDVLVAPYTNPSWTPLFGRAAAVVVDAGSAMSHAAIVAREYGIPAVMGTGNAMHRLRDGQQVIVDGTRGLVFSTDADEAPGVTGP